MTPRKIAEIAAAVLGLAGLTTALCLTVSPAGAQMSILPSTCAGKSGEALDNCVREITPPQIVVHPAPVEAKADPMQIMNCMNVLRADQGFCIRRNESIIECRNRTRHPDFKQCIADTMTRLTLPQAADCLRVGKDSRNECAQRNKVFKGCVKDPLRYFICLGEKTPRK